MARTAASGKTALPRARSRSTRDAIVAPRLLISALKYTIPCRTPYRVSALARTSFHIPDTALFCRAHSIGVRHSCGHRSSGTPAFHRATIWNASAGTPPRRRGTASVSVRASDLSLYPPLRGISRTAVPAFPDRRTSDDDGAALAVRSSDRPSPSAGSPAGRACEWPLSSTSAESTGPCETSRIPSTIPRIADSGDVSMAGASSGQRART